MRKKIGLLLIFSGLVLVFQNCAQAPMSTNSESSELASSEQTPSQAETEAMIISKLDQGRNGESCDDWLKRNGVTATTKKAIYAHNNLETVWGEGGEFENSACAVMVYTSELKTWSCSGAASFYIDKFDQSANNWSYPTLECDDGTRRVRTQLSGLSESN